MCRRRRRCSPRPGWTPMRSNAARTGPGSTRPSARSPRAATQPTALHNNCSGKHAGFLCLACARHGRDGLRGFARGYVTPEHAVMREVTAALQAATGFDLSTAPRGTDGCSIPTFAIPLHHLALGLRARGHRPGAVGRPRQGGEASAPRGGQGAVHGRRHGPLRHPRHGAARRACLLQGRCRGRLLRRAARARPRRGDQDGRRQHRTRRRGGDGRGDRGACHAGRRRGGAACASLSEPTLRNWNGIEVGRLAASSGLRDALARPLS